MGESQDTVGTQVNPSYIRVIPTGSAHSPCTAVDSQEPEIDLRHFKRIHGFTDTIFTNLFSSPCYRPPKSTNLWLPGRFY